MVSESPGRNVSEPSGGLEKMDTLETLGSRHNRAAP
jgi:hypothetical protein